MKMHNMKIIIREEDIKVRKRQPRPLIVFRNKKKYIRNKVNELRAAEES